MPELKKEDLIKQINQIYKTLMNACFQLSKSYAKRAFNIKPVIYDRNNILRYLKEQGICESISLSDEKYRIIDWETWKTIILADWSEQREYVVDFFDCDNFGFNFSARMGDFFELNTAGTAYGWICDKEGKVYGGHAFNVILTEDNLGVRRIFVYEPIDDTFVEYKKGEKIELRLGIYKINWVIFF